MSRLKSFRTRPAFTLLESLVMLVILSVWCVVTFAVVKARLRNPAPLTFSESPRATPLESLTGGHPAAGAQSKIPDEERRKDKAASRSN